ncbi:hypothetical protein BCR34DRAFT_489505 [Clohesyomyces aquaticus]|uniref:Uncharacterized protein n=1 Tax=Clohesyomyces aquaticus TaxID=1231657 RepID=A0A1Y1ZAX1_9PLEO|nr:hypothetical protein BCR34DRAFT_489505 [Clohesyomyces aquaticus]
MAPKHTRDDGKDGPAKKAKGGFSVGPANLPDGIHKRKVQKIKKDLIQKAKLRKEYAKVKAREQPDTTHKSVYEREEANEAPNGPAETAPEPTLEPHPDRARLWEEPSPEPEQAQHQRIQRDRRPKRPRPQPYKEETEIARKRKEGADARRQAREDAGQERQEKIAERERFRKAMAKARSGGPNCQRKLGRESNVLLEKVKRMVGSA